MYIYIYIYVCINTSGDGAREQFIAAATATHPLPHSASANVAGVIPRNRAADYCEMYTPVEWCCQVCRIPSPGVYKFSLSLPLFSLFSLSHALSLTFSISHFFFLSFSLTL